MPINVKQLAYASNHDGRGDLNCLAHVLVAHIKAGRLIPETLALLRGAYNVFYRSKKGFRSSMSDRDFLDRIKSLTPVQIEKEITPILESLRSKDPKGSSLNGFIRLANSLGIKVEVYGAEFKEEDDEIQEEYVNFIPSKNLKLPTAAELREEIEETDELGDVAFHWNGRVRQNGFADDAPKIRLFLKKADEGRCDFYFEYPTEQDEDDMGLSYTFEPEEQEQVAVLQQHNEAIRKENERVRKAREDEGQPLSFGKSISMLITLLGGIFAKFVEVCMGALSHFQRKPFDDFGSKSTTDIEEGQQPYEATTADVESESSRPGSPPFYVDEEPIISPRAVFFSDHFKDARSRSPSFESVASGLSQKTKPRSVASDLAENFQSSHGPGSRKRSNSVPY